MEYIKGRLDEAINGLEAQKKRYPKMETQDVIGMLKRLLDIVKDQQFSPTAVVQVKPEKVLNDYPYKHQLKKITQLNQNQSSLKDQLQLLRPFANKLGLYDAADYIKD